MRTVFVSIGNSDDKLKQRDWSMYVKRMDGLLSSYETARHGFWLSPGDSLWQNACWCVVVPTDVELLLKEKIAQVAGLFRQDSVAWASADVTFVKGVMSS